VNGYISVKEAAERWGVTERQVQRMCLAGKIPGVIQFIGAWVIPEDAVKPTRTGKLKTGPKPKAANAREDTKE
jgi:predicted site-specific integrase-resolvase